MRPKNVERRTKEIDSRAHIVKQPQHVYRYASLDLTSCAYFKNNFTNVCC